MDLDSGQARVVNMIKTIKYLHDWRSWDRQVPSQYRTSKNYMVSRKVYFLLLQLELQPTTSMVLRYTPLQVRRFS